MNQLEQSKKWHKRGSVYKAKTMDALKDLYSPTTAPGHEPKGIAKNAPSTRATDTPKTKKADK